MATMSGSFTVVAENRTHHQNFVFEARYKKRTNGPVNQRAVSVSFSDGRASLLKKPPEFYPAA